MLDNIVQQFCCQERYKNGHVLTSYSTANKYKCLKNILCEFTQKVYRKKFSKYHFRDINEVFLTDFVQYLKKRASLNGNAGGISEKLKTLHATFTFARRQGVLNVRMSVFDPVRKKLKRQPVIPKTISHKTVNTIEQMDTSWLS